VYIASADLMPRNLDHRVEMAVPIIAPDLRAELTDVLERAFADNTSAWQLDSAGVWGRLRPGPGEEPRNLQRELIEEHAHRAAEDRGGQQDSHGAAPHEASAHAREDLAASVPRASRPDSEDW